MPGDTQKKKYTGYVCGACRWSILSDVVGRGLCRRNPPSIPGGTPADPQSYPTVDLKGKPCGEWTVPVGR